MSGWVRACNRSACIEVMRSGESILIRDSKDPCGVTLRFAATEFAEFIDGAKRGVFDGLLS